MNLTEMSNVNRIIYILGMHRSGTSVVTRIMNLLGAEVGANLLSGHTQINEKGFWENRALIDIHDAMLGNLGSAWFDFRRLPENWWKREDLHSYGPAIAEVLERDYQSLDLIVVKDPRLCRLLPFWHHHLQKVIQQPACLLVIRNPVEVVASLVKRDGFDIGYSSLLWLTYILDAELHSRNLPRAFIRYEAVLKNWKPEIQRISEEMGIQWPNTVESIENEISDEINPNLRHHHARETATENGHQMLQLAVKAYDIITSGNWDIISEHLNELRAHLFTNNEKESALGEAAFNTTLLLTKKTKEFMLLGEELERTKQQHWSWRLGKRFFQVIGALK